MSDYSEINITGANSTLALHEIHLFLAPVNPPKEILDKYYAAVKEWNELIGPGYKAKYGEFQMKPCNLCLIFRTNERADLPVYVMQTAIYCRSNSPKEVIEQTHNQIVFFSQKGFELIREKIEASAYGNIGIPLSAEDYPKNIKTYFEFHIKTKFQNKEESEPVTKEELELLKDISKKLTVLYSAPVPLSFNSGNDNQRFLNVRFRKIGMLEIEPKLKLVKELIDQTNLKIIKTISEYVWYDTNPSMDKGWIDFLDTE